MGNSTSGGSAEQRVHVRISTIVPCVVQSKAGVNEARLVDVSKSGGQLEADLPVAELGDTITVALGLPSDAVHAQVEAEIVRAEHTDSGFRYGLRFTLMDPSSRAVFNSYLDSLADNSGGANRSHVRLARRLAVELNTAQQLASVMRDVSQGGIGLTTDVGVALEEPVRIHVVIPGHPALELPGRVAYVHQMKSGGFAVGVSFTELKPVTRAALDAFLKKLSSS